MATKLVKKLEELEQLVLAHLRERPETASIRSVRGYLHQPDSGGHNWNIYRFEAGASDTDNCQRAICRVTDRLRREFYATDAEVLDSEWQIWQN